MRIQLSLIGLLLTTHLSAQRMVKEFFPGKDNCFINFMGNLKNGFVFSSYSLDKGIEPWISVGTTEGTKMIKDIYPGTGSSLISSSVFTNDSFVFFVAQESNRNGLWRTDGTAEGTIFLHKFEYTIPEKHYNELCFHNGLLYFNSADNFRNRLWSTDGTVSGTKEVHVFNDSGMYNKISLNSWNDQLYIFASDREHGIELWTSDGTDAGTQLLKDIYPGTMGSVMYQRSKMLPAGDLLFFSARSSDVEGYELFCTDGTSAGTRLFKDINKSPFFSSYPGLTTGTGDYLFFNTLNDSSFVWITDGSLVNTKPLFKSNADGGINNYIYSVFPYNNQYLMYYYNTNVGTELYLCDNQFDNIKLIKDINPELQNSYMKDKVFVHNNKAYFLAANSMLGVDIWTTDGTFNNTTVYQEFIETVGSEDIIQWNDRIFFIGSVDPNIGAELYELDLNKNTGITSASADKINIYPNPGHPGSNLNIDVEDGTVIRWYNTSGQMVYENRCYNSKTEVPSITRGIYTIELKTNDMIQHIIIMVD